MPVATPWHFVLVAELLALAIGLLLRLQERRAEDRQAKDGSEEGGPA